MKYSQAELTELTYTVFIAMMMWGASAYIFTTVFLVTRLFVKRSVSKIPGLAGDVLHSVVLLLATTIACLGQAILPIL